MFDVAQRTDRMLVEASWVRWHPRFQRMVALAESGALGALTSIDSSFTFSGAMTDNYRLAPELGGGALLDVGCYQAQAWVAFTGGAPEVGVHSVECVRGDTGVDLTTRATASIAGGVRATMLSSFVLPAGQSLEVTGTDTSMRTGAGEAFTSWRETSTLHVGASEEHFDAVDAFVVMIEETSRRIVGDSGWVVPPPDSLRTAEILDTISSQNAALSED